MGEGPGGSSTGLVPWGPRSVAVGIVLAIVSTAVVLTLATVTTAALGRDVVPEDVGDIFTKASRALDYADKRLEAADEGRALPSPPRLFGDRVAAYVFYVAGMANGVALAAVALAATRQSPVSWAKHAGLDRIDWGSLWQPLLLTGAAYTLVVGYSIAVEAAGVDLLVPDEQVPRVVLRDSLALGLFGIIAVVFAPLGEEIFYRGLLFGGLTRWGFWPAALVSGFIFAASHIDPGLYLPFTAVGVLAAWLFWRRRSLWQNIAFHMFFNGWSLVLLLLTK